MPRRIASRLGLVFAASIAVAACNASTSSASAGPATAAPTTAAPAETEPASAPPASDESLEPYSSAMTQTNTAWGRIWDAIPAAFPVYPGAEATTDIGEPASAQFAVSGDVTTVTTWTSAALDAAGLRTTVSGPLEDGSMTLDSVGANGCAAKTSIARLGGVTLETILYGARCPFA